MANENQTSQLEHYLSNMNPVQVSNLADIAQVFSMEIKNEDEIIGTILPLKEELTYSTDNFTIILELAKLALLIEYKQDPIEINKAIDIYNRKYAQKILKFTLND